jgi:hypothetical protein
MTNATLPSPAGVRAAVTRTNTAIRQAENTRQASARARYMRQRRQAARAAGSRGPLTREELAAQCAQAAR